MLVKLTEDTKMNSGIIICLSLALFVGTISADVRPRIVSGDDANIQDFPYQASLRFFGRHFCGGSIISEKHILTAAHCVKNYFIYPYLFVRVHTGTSSSVSSGDSHRVSSITVHPDYKGTEESSFRNDIAIITLADTIEFDEYQQKVELPTRDVQDDEEVVLTGWGLTSTTGRTAPVQLQKLDLKLITSEKCQPTQSAQIYKEQVCAFNRRGVGACSGDSGGPLVAHGEVVGIVSWVDGEVCAAGIPEVYTNVYAYREFIQSVINQRRSNNIFDIFRL